MTEDEQQVTDFQDRFLFSLSQLSTAFGPARETVAKRLMEAGIAPRGKRRGHDVYHIGDVVPAILLGDVQAFDGVRDPENLPPKERLDFYRSENEKMKLEREQGVLVPRGQHEQALADLAKILIQTMETLSDSLERRQRLPQAVLEQVETEIDAVREELAQRLENYGLG